MTEGAERSKMRLLHERLAAVVAGLRHGEMICVSDAGAGTGAKALVSLADDVERIDLGVATNIPTTLDVLRALGEVGDFEAAVIADVTEAANPPIWEHLTATYGADAVHVVSYFPDWYELRNRVKVFVQTGDYGLAATAILVAGYPSPNIPFEWLASRKWYDDLVAGGKTLVADGDGWSPAADGK